MLGHQVDHVRPLADGGLHCVKNLQILTKQEHARKTAEERRQRLLTREQSKII